ncbi:hypothetical protein EW145_g6171 [Phellinidium pouzarii]|uniref:Ubiquitin 3 binding protein But2 C-terminal domain-containing protein n=1 Tax=Phellinidium pouzarii TaxID=167371 RepID=A0A4S4KXH0_9AGAM|nr:hypothetical protein EW145_g6171 [Phellinidium pouzarii]
MRYTQLPSEDFTTGDELEDLPRAKPSDPFIAPNSSYKTQAVPVQTVWNRVDWTLIATAIALLFTFSSLSLLSINIFHSRNPPTGSLRRPSTYIGLGQITRNASSPDWPRKIYTYPDSFGVVDSRIPKGVHSEPGHVTVGSTCTAIFHFSVHDFGLENCAISSFFPTENGKPVKEYAVRGQVDTLQVWLLEGIEQTDSGSTQFLWSTKPPRHRLLGTLNATSVSDILPSFHCPSRSTLAIEKTKTEIRNLDGTE